MGRRTVQNRATHRPRQAYTDAVGSIPAGEDVLDPDEPTYDLSRVAELLGVSVSKVLQQLREGHLVAVRRDGGVVVPQVFFTNKGQLAKCLPGLLTILHDGGYRDTEIVRWLFTPDPSLTVTRDGSRDALNNARPVDALHAHQAREVVRRAQAMAY
ncbi:DNA-binding protein [Mycobacterium bourgelatii]|nr:DNA-binding protein [Mycobacterium bourgelatii]